VILWRSVDFICSLTSLRLSTNSAYWLTKQLLVMQPGTLQHCWLTDTSRRNPCSVCTPSIYWVLMTTSWFGDQDWDAHFLLLLHEYGIDRVETMWINRSVQTENFSVYFIVLSIWIQQFLNCAMPPRLTCRGATQITVILYYIYISCYNIPLFWQEIEVY